MHLIRRQIRLVRAIYENKQLGLKELSQHLGVSLQTVKSDLSQLTAIMNDYHVRMMLLPGNQIQLLGQENVGYMLKEFQSMQDFSLEKQARLLLLLQSGFIVLQDMADALFVSKSLMEKVMSVMLKKHAESLESVRHHGIHDVSLQMERRNTFAELIMPYLKGIDFAQEIEEFHQNHFPLLDYIDRTEVANAAEAMRLIQSSTTFSFTDESVTMLFLQMIFIAYCHHHWQHVPHETLVTKLMSDVQDKARYAVTTTRVCELLRIPASESSYFSYLFLMLRKQSMSDTEFYLREMHDVLSAIMEHILARTAIDLRRDETLWRGLAVHIYTTVIRRDQLKTAFLEQAGEGIRQEYPIGLEMAVAAAQVIKERLSYTVSEEELVYLTLHFQAALERMKSLGQELRIIVVCHYGMAAASLIAARLERIRTGIRVIGTMSMQAFKALQEPKADLIVSTESIHRQRGMPPLICVTPMLPDRELDEIRQFAELHCFNNIMMIYIMQAAILTIDAKNKDDVLRQASDFLTAQGQVSPAYLESLRAREALSSTDLGIIAVPHGNPDEVKKTQLVILRLKQPVDWGVSAVHYVFLFAVRREDFRDRFALITQFYKRLARPALRTRLGACSSLDEQAFRLSFIHMMSA